MSKQNRVAHASPLPAGIVELSVHRPPHISHATPDFLAEEVPVALVYNGISHVVMMASPKDLELFPSHYYSFSIHQQNIRITNHSLRLVKAEI